MEIGRKIKAALEALGKTQREIAEIMRVEEKAVSYWESARSNPTAETIARIAQAMGVTTGFIMDYGDPGAEWQHPVTGAAKTDMVKKLLRELADHHPYGLAAKALRFLEEGEDDPPEFQALVAKLRKIVLSGNRTAINALLSNLEAFTAPVDAEERRPPPAKEVVASGG